MASFHLSPILPKDLRLEIWERIATQHRVVAFLEPGEASQNLIPGYSVPTPAPAMFHVGRESRAVGVRKYEKAFVDGHRYAWINFDVDTVRVNWNNISMAFPERTRIKHIQAVHRPHMDDDALGFLSAVHGIAQFPQLETFEFLVDFLIDCASYINGVSFGRRCPKKNVRVIVAATGEYVK